MPRIHFLEQWFKLSDPAMEEALYDTPMFHAFAGLNAGEDNLPDVSTIMRFGKKPSPSHGLEERRRSISGLVPLEVSTDNGRVSGGCADLLKW